MDSLSILAMAAAQVQQQELSQSRDCPQIEPYKKDKNLQSYAIRRGKKSDIPLLKRVERSAGNRFRTVGLDAVADCNTVDPERLTRMSDANHLWVGVDSCGPIGFLCGEEMDGNFHIVKISVSHECQGRGVGKSLMMAMLDQIKLERSFKSVTLTAFRNLSWNGPWYSKMGFGEVHPRLMGTAYDLILETEEAKHGFDHQELCLMMKDLFY